ncbi:hypothetical protein [Streptomyces sp. MBT62]|uniref:hypothetical protein n=1 Tax=Streptomyces sp. MBT62 TaxID=2800410 RepID=UPI0019098580|nr:hypothetical protein [Streptomyces sp. MBT62]MBK3570015.1 hypothetical protein [Streptomyces sp. MBT62]
MQITKVIRNCVDAARAMHGDLTPLLKRAVAEVCPLAKHVWDYCDGADHPGRFLAEKVVTTDFPGTASASAGRERRGGHPGVRSLQAPARTACPDPGQRRRDSRAKQRELFEARHAERQEREAAEQERRRARRAKGEAERQAEREKRARARQTPAERRRRRAEAWTPRPKPAEPAANSETMLAEVMKFYGENADVPNAEAMLSSAVGVWGENSAPARIARTNLARAKARCTAAGTGQTAPRNRRS